MFVAFLFGCFCLRVIKNLITAPTAIVKFEIAIDSFVEKPQKVIKKGMIKPPPPIPPTLAAPNRTGKIIVPMNSIKVIGKMSL